MTTLARAIERAVQHCQDNGDTKGVFLIGEIERLVEEELDDTYESTRE